MCAKAEAKGRGRKSEGEEGRDGLVNRAAARGAPDGSSNGRCRWESCETDDELDYRPQPSLSSPLLPSLPSRRRPVRVMAFSTSSSWALLVDTFAPTTQTAQTSAEGGGKVGKEKTLRAWRTQRAHRVERGGGCGGWGSRALARVNASIHIS